MNLELSICQPGQQTSVVAAQRPKVTHPGPKIERREFEQLLQHAMEILNARDLQAQLNSPSSTSATSSTFGI